MGKNVTPKRYTKNDVQALIAPMPVKIEELELRIAKMPRDRPGSADH